MISEESYSNYVSEMTEGQLKEYIHTVGKAANQRLRELEKRGLQKSSAAYRYIEKLGFDKDYATSKTGAGELKFNLRVRGRNFSELRHMVSTIDKFMEAKSSTVGGVKDIYRQAAETYAKEHEGKEFGDAESYKNFTEAMSNTLFRHFEAMYGSQIALRIANQAEAGGLSETDIEEALAAAGFTEGTTREGLPTVSAIERSIDEFIANKKSVVYEKKEESNGLLTPGFEL